MKMTHEEYVQKNRGRVGQLAQGMIDGSIHYLEGSIELSSLLYEVDVPENDEDFSAFIGIASEIDHLPIGPPRQYWSKKALARHEPEIQKSIEWAKEFSLSQCKSLAERFSA